MQIQCSLKSQMVVCLMKSFMCKPWNVYSIRFFHTPQDSSGQAAAGGISHKEARAAKRAAQAEKRRLEVERKRREREEQAKKEKEDQERQERLQRELEEDRRRREEERRYMIAILLQVCWGILESSSLVGPIQTTFAAQLLQERWTDFFEI